MQRVKGTIKRMEHAHCTGRLKKTRPCFISLYLWQFITVWTDNTLVVCCKLSLAYQMIVKAYSKP